MLDKSVVQYIGDHLLSDGYVASSPGIYVRRIDKTSSRWISISGNRFIINVNIGLVRADVNKVVRSSLSRINSPYAGAFSSGKASLPIIMLSLDRCESIFGSDSEGKISVPGGEIGLDHAARVVETIESAGDKFFRHIDDSGKLLNFIEKNHINIQSTKYLLPALIAISGDRLKFDDFSRANAPALDGDKNTVSYVEYIEDLRASCFA